MDEKLFKDIVLSQYLTSATMLKKVINSCPDSMWEEPVNNSKNLFWRVSFHAMYLIDYYSGDFDANLKDPVDGYQAPEFLNDTEIAVRFTKKMEKAYSKTESLQFLKHAISRTKRLLKTYTNFAEPSVFPWLKMTKAEALIYGMRHVQNHVGQLTATLSNSKENAVEWIVQD